MQIVAEVRRYDIPDEAVVLIGYEKTIDPDIDEVMYVGIRSDGDDDNVFAFVPSEDEIYDVIDSKWGQWDTFEWRV